MTLSKSDLETVLEFLHHDNPNVYKQAIDIIARAFQVDSIGAVNMVGTLLSDKNGQRIFALLNKHWTEVVGGSIMAILVNIASCGEKNPVFIRRLCDLNSTSHMIRFLRKNKLLNSLSEENLPDNIHAEQPENLQELGNLVTIFLSNLTVSLNDVALESLLQLDKDDELARGFYLESIIDHMASSKPSYLSTQWLLYILVNLSSNSMTCSAISKHHKFLQFIHLSLQKKPAESDEFASCVKIVRNLVFSQKSVNQAQQVLIQEGIADDILENLSTSGNLSPSMCSLLAEIVFFICTSDDGIRWIESINGKKILQELLNNKGHVIHSSECKNAEELLSTRLIPILDDIQDVTLTNNEDISPKSE